MTIGIGSTGWARGLRLAAVLGCVLAATSWAWAVTEDPVGTRAYEVQYRPLSDTADLVSEILSPDGELTLKPSKKVLIVQDRRSILEQVAELIASYDLPPRTVEIRLSLFMGSRDEGASPRVDDPEGNGFGRKVRGVMETLGDFTVWTAFEPLGTRVLSGREGSIVETAINENYAVAVQVGAVGDEVIAFDRFTLRAIIREPGKPDRVEDLITASVVVDAGRMTMVAAAKGPEAPQALFVALQAEPR